MDLKFGESAGFVDWFRLCWRSWRMMGDGFLVDARVRHWEQMYLRLGSDFALWRGCINRDAIRDLSMIEVLALIQYRERDEVE